MGNIVIQLIAGVFLFLGVGSLFTKSKNPKTAEMTSVEHALICTFFIAGGIFAFIFLTWIPLVIGLAAIYLVHYLFFSSRRGEKNRPILHASDYNNSEKLNWFLDWWLKNDPQVKEVKGIYIESIWNEGIKPVKLGKEKFGSPEEYFRSKFEKRLQKLKDASKEQWVFKLKESGNEAINSVKILSGIADKYNIDLNTFNYATATAKIPNEGELKEFKLHLISESLLSNQRRLLMWLYHSRFNEWYTPQF